MRPRASFELLSQLAGIRMLQQQAAEAETARATMALAGSERELERIEAEDDSAEHEWHRELAMPAIALDLLLIKAHALLDTDASVTDAKAARDRARDEQAKKRAGLLQSTLLSGAAKSMAREAARYEAEKREEARLAETLDRFRTTEVLA
jgi:hypothetical protein